MKIKNEDKNKYIYLNKFFFYLKLRFNIFIK
jgi:hypothetical protein